MLSRKTVSGKGLIGEDVHAPRPRTCPGCNTNWMEGPSFGDPYGKPALFVIENELGCHFLKGWQCEGVVFGTVFFHRFLDGLEMEVDEKNVVYRPREDQIVRQEWMYD